MEVLRTILKFVQIPAVGYLLLMMGLNFSVHAQPSQEYQIKAVFLYNFTQFVEWPEASLPEDTTPFVIGILGKDPFGSYLDETVHNEKIKNHPLVVQQFKDVAEITTCHILYITITDKGELKSIFDALRSKNILTVGDVNNFAKQGGMVQFYTEESKIRIRINIDAVKGTSLIISSKLLKLADIIEDQNN